MHIATKLACLLFTLLFSNQVISQSFQPPSSRVSDRIKAFEVKAKMNKESLLNKIPFTNVGPTVMSGRVVDIEVNPDDPTEFYVAYASGGLWKTINNGTTFEPLFENEAVMTIGDIDVHWGSGKIYVGTGEVNSSRSSYAGLGVYSSDDLGKTWLNLGLHDTHHIGRVIVSNDNPEEILVAALGHLYSDNNERGVFKSIDGGKSWLKVLFINSKTGVVDLIQDPANSNTLYAASWERERRAWDFIEAGEGSGIYKSTDGGDTWTMMTDGENGFPTGEGTGRIGLSVYNDGQTQKIYALLDNYNRRPVEPSEEIVLSKEKLRNISVENFNNLDNELLNEYLRANRFDRKYNAKSIKSMVKSGKIQPIALVEYVEDANSLLFDAPVIGAEVYVSEDGAKTWKKTHDGYIEYLYNSYGYYFGLIQVSPSNPEHVYIAGVPILKSKDGGSTWSNINKENVHVDHHSLWINGNKEGHLINGNDGGINISYDDGENWIKCNSPAVGQFYYVNVDNEKPYNIYGGAQDNGVWFGPSNYSASKRWHNSGDYPYKSLVGGDGMQVQVDSRDNTTVYAGLQFGNYYRIDRISRDQKFITPRHELGDRPLRWNWQAPILISSHNQDVVYMGSNFLHRSFNKGDVFKIVSKDLSNGGRKGDVAYGTLTTIHESSLQFGLLYTGSDDGLIHVSKDGGYSWSKISNELPQDMWVSRVQASTHELSRVFASLNGYRWDDFTPYLYVSEDYGSTWKRIGKELPHEAINVVKEDPEDPNVLYVGTDHGIYVSFDMGENFTIMNKDLPAVPIHDLVIQNEAGEIVLGTHGRSFYKASVKEIQQLNKIRDKKVHLFALNSIRSSSRWGAKPNIFQMNPGPNYEFSLFVPDTRTLEMKILSEEDNLLHSQKLNADRGISFQKYDMTISKQAALSIAKNKDSVKAGENGKYYLPKGKYKMVVSSGSDTSEQSFEVK